MAHSSGPVDVAIVGAGAAGLATAIFAARCNPGLRIIAIDGAERLGAKILVSGGGRCNITNTRVTPRDFRGGSQNTIRRILSAFPVHRTVAFFDEIGVSLHEEDDGKLFPDTNSSRTVLDALLRETVRCNILILANRRVTQVERRPDGFRLDTSSDPILAHSIVLATGGLSLPKTGSDGTGYQLARSLGHCLVPPTPALTPFVLDGDFHKSLSGIAQEVELAVRVESTKIVRLSGSMLWTHFGISGPVALNASGLWHRARLENRSVAITANLLPGRSFETAERELIALGSSHPKTLLHNALTHSIPFRVAVAVLERLEISPKVSLAHLTREDRRKLIHALVEWPLPICDTRGYRYAEVTAGGIPLDEINSTTMASVKCPGLYLVGEILDVDGRIGGFNFQWAWSTAWVAASALARVD